VNAVEYKLPYWVTLNCGYQMVRKTYGRIFVRKAADVERVTSIMKEMDYSEVDCYMPHGVVVVWPGLKDAILTYTHKFEIRIDELRFRCWEAGIEVMIVTGYKERY